MKEAIDVIDQYDALLKRALEIAADLPKYVHEPRWAKLEIRGDIVRLSWPHDVLEYDSSVIEEEAVEFSSALLLASAAEIKEWKQQMAAERKRQEAAWHDMRKRQVEAEERRHLAALKAKYGE